MKVFIVGATGEIGRRVVPLLVSAGHKVTATSRTSEKRHALARAGARVVEASLFDPTQLRREIAHHDVVINLAPRSAASLLRIMPRAWAENDRVRRIGSANLVDAALVSGTPRFIQESLAPAYPDSGEAWIDESVRIAPGVHDRAVVDAERSAEEFTGAGGTGVVLRFGAVYGPGSGPFAGLVRWVRRGFAPLPGSPRAFISSVSHDDAAAAVLAALDVPAGVYSVADDEPVSHREYVDSLAAALGVVPPRLPSRWSKFIFGPGGELLARSLRVSNRKLRDASGWRPRHPSVRQGFQICAKS